MRARKRACKRKSRRGSRRERHSISYTAWVLEDGRVRHVASRARVLGDTAGRPLKLVGTNRDVTDDRLADEERARL